MSPQLPLRAVQITLLLFTIFTYSQTSTIKITVDWEDKSYENKDEVYNPANNLLLSVSNPDDPFTSDTPEVYLETNSKK